MHKHFVLSVFLLASAGPLFAQPEEDTPAEEDQGQIEKLVEQQNKLADDYNAILRKIKQSEELVVLDKAVAEAKGRLAKAEGENDALTAARLAEQDAKQAVRQAIEQKLKEHGVGGQLLERLNELQLKRAENLWQVELAKFQMNHALSPINRALADDAELAAAKAKLDKAAIDERTDAKAVYDTLRAAKLEEVVEAQRLLATIEDAGDAAQRMQESIVAVEERLAPIRKEIEAVENKRVEQARDEIAAALNSDAIVALRKEVNEAVTKYNELITKLVAENEEALKMKAEYDAVRAKIKELRAAQ